MFNKFLYLSSLLGFLFVATQLAFGQNHSQKLPKLCGDGTIQIYRSHTQKMKRFTYHANGKFNVSELKKIDRHLRSRTDQKVKPIDRRLICLLDHLEDHFGARQIEVISGFRSSAMNKSLKAQGRSVADESFHIKGMATDIHIDEIDEKNLVNYLKKIHQGGIGYYPNLLMVHVDFGPNRFWQEGRFKNRLNIGVFNPKSTVRLKTNSLFYRRGERILLQTKYIKQNSKIIIEKFIDSSWQALRTYSSDEFTSLYKHGEDQKNNQNQKKQNYQIPISSQKSQWPYGKYRFRVVIESDPSLKPVWQHSNEFYLKKRAP